MKTCIVIVPALKDVCGKPATYAIHWTGDDPPAHACHSCALDLQRQAETHGTRIKLERLEQ